MAETRRVLVTDYSWPDLDTELSVLAPAGVELVVASTGAEPELRELAHDVEAILTCWARVPASVLAAAPRCLTVARYGVGLDNIDVEEATRLGIVVSNVPDYCFDEVADHTMALMLALTRRLLPLNRDVRHGGWDNAAGGTPRRLAGQVLGLVGFGAVARAVARRATAHGLQVLAFGRDPQPPSIEGVRIAGSLAQLLEASDIVSLHLPLTEATRGIIGAAELALCKPSTIVLNTARGALVDTAALLRALESGALAGAGLDVTEPEPLPADHPLRSRADVILTPHAAFYSDGSIRELAEKAAHNVLNVLSGRRPRWVCNPAVLASSALRPSLTPMTVTPTTAAP